MTKRLERDAIYLKRHFDAEIIVLSVRWYITYKLSYRDLAAMMAERGVVVSHTTIMRWVISYAPEFEERWSRFSRSIGCSWRVDETNIAIKGSWHYLYRAVDKHGRTVDFLLRPDRGIAAAQAFFRKALASHRSSAAEDYIGWPLAQSSGAALASARAPCVAQSQSPQLRVSEQHRRTRCIRKCSQFAAAARNCSGAKCV
jgi:transposase-like protein